MEIKEVKKHLYNNPYKIVDLLENCGCHKIKHYDGKRIQACRPKGDNPSSVQVILNDTNLNCVIHTDPEFDGGDIFYLIAHLKNIENSRAIRWVYKELGFNLTYEPKETSSALDFVNEFVRYDLRFDKDNKVINQPLPEVLFGQFIKSPHVKFTKENINIDVQQEFNICFDSLSKRIIIPIYDTKGNLITFKGRATDNETRPKYVAYYPFNGSNILYGYHNNLFNIFRENEAIIFEAEKSVLKARSMGIDNSLALMRHKPSNEQIEKIIKLQTDIVWAMDKDISPSEIVNTVDDLDGLVNIYIIHDKDGLLNQKDSPVDKGLNVWNVLYENKIKFNEFKNKVKKGDL